MSDMSAQRRPTGDAITVSVEFKRWVIEQIAARGWTRAEFARRLKYPDGQPVADASITQLLGREGAPLHPSRTRLRPLIESVLGPFPSPADDDPSFQIVRENWNNLSAERKQSILLLVDPRPKPGDR